MSLPSTTIDRIVANVLNQLGGGDRIHVHQNGDGDNEDSTAVRPSSVDGENRGEIALSDKVLTAEVFEKIKCSQLVSVLTNAIITPAACDVIKERKIQIVRGDVKSATAKEKSKGQGIQSLNCYVVKHTDALERAIAEINPNKKDLLSCPDDAAKAAISEICRGEANIVLIFVEQVHRAACLANRNESVKAVVVSDSGDVKEVKKQLRANVWCVNPKGRSYFELKNLLKGLKVEG